MDAIISFIVERWPFLAVILVVVAITILICKWYFSRFVSVEKNSEEATARIKELEEARKYHEESWRRHDEHMKELDEHLKELKKTNAKLFEFIIEIRTFLATKFPEFGTMVAAKNSPRKLTEEGIRLFNDIGGKAFLEINGAKLMAKIESEEPKTPFDVELSALGSLYAHLNDDMFNDLKRWVYYSSPRKMIIDGKEQNREITMCDVCFVLSIPLRDMYLEVHPEIH